jgi:adenylate cyclase
MATEIERKFLPKGESWKRAIDSPGTGIRQGYLSSVRERTVRIRVNGAQGWITVKGANTGASRPEFEYPIPLDDANAILDSLCEKPLIEKTRYVVMENGCAFEIDEFHAENAGLIVIEIELASEDQAVDLPDWIGEEVTHDPRYYNSNLARHPGSWRREPA